LRGASPESAIMVVMAAARAGTMLAQAVCAGLCGLSPLYVPHHR
jgi:hypothetical protein